MSDETDLTADVTRPGGDPGVEAGPGPGSASVNRTRGASVPASRFKPGDLLGGRYRVVAFLGKGGMGEVYRADDLELAQSVAIKLLPARVAADPLLAERVRQEVRLARQVSHRNVCRIHDISRLSDAEGGDLFISMEFVDGEDLATLLRRIGRIPQDKAVDIARQLCAALAAAHEQGVVHRDLKPANVMLDGRGNVRLTDFGIAAAVEDQEEDASGTPAYMAPEQYEGRPAGPRADIYALGLVIYELLTGRPGWKASSLAELRTLREGTGAPPPLTSSHHAEIDPALAALVDRCLDTDPEERPASALAVAAALPGADPLAAALAAGETPSPELIAASGGRGVLRPRVAALLVAAILVLAGVSDFLTRGQTLLSVVDPPPPEPILREAAVEMLERLGQGVPTEAATETGWTVIDASGRRLSGAIAGGEDIGWSALNGAFLRPIRFWLRIEPGGFTAVHPARQVTPEHPPLVDEGAALIQLDDQRRLRMLRVRPPRRVGASSEVEPDWAGVFSLAGLEYGAFTPIEAARNDGMDATVRRAWRGEIADIPGLDPVAIEVYAGASDGRLCEFTITMATPDDASGGEGGKAGAPPVNQGPSGAAHSIQQAAFYIIMGSITLVAGLLAYRNIRLRRSDTRRAIRFGVAFFLLTSVASLLRADSSIASVEALLGPYPVYGLGIGLAVVASLCYIAAEPLARTRLPRALVSWTRLTSARFRDPMVGRDLLIGMTAGTAIVAVAAGARAAAGLLGPDPILPSSSWLAATLDGPRQMLVLCLDGLASALLNATAVAILVLFAMVVLQLVRIRAKWPALGLVVLLILAQSLAIPNMGVTDRAGIAIANLLLLVVLDRGGLRAAAAARATCSMLCRVGEAAPYDGGGAGAPAVPAAFLLAGIVFAYRTATAGRSLFGGEAPPTR